MSPRVRSIKKITPRVWIPPNFTALFKIEVVRSDGVTTDDITDLILGGRLTDGVNETIGDFDFTLDNSAEDFTNVWTGNEIINIYIDYATTATTKRFRGRLEKVSYPNNNVRIKGRTESHKMLDLTVTKSGNNVETSVVLSELIDTYIPSFTKNNINVSTKNYTFNWYQKPFWEAAQELANASGFSIYVDVNLDVHYFESGSVNNTTEAVVHESNLLEVGDFAQDQSLVKNRIIVYGSETDGIPLIATSEDTTSISSLGIKELIVEDNNIITFNQAQERADFELSLAKDPPIVGEIKSMGLATIQPGENIQISASLSNLDPKFYKIISYTNNFDGFMTTTLKIEKEPRKIYHIIKDRISKEQTIKERPNPNEMRFTYLDPFDSSSGDHTNTVIVDGVIKTDGSSSGTWISDIIALSSNATAGEIRVVGNTISGTVFSVSTDSGVTFQTMSIDTAVNFSPPGQNLKIKIELNSSETQIQSIGLLYKK